MNFQTILAILAGLIIGAAAVWIIAQKRIGELAAEAAELRAQNRFADEKIGLLNDAQRRLSDAFKALSADALHSNNQAFLDLANATLAKFQESAKGELESRHRVIAETLKPLKESLERVDTKINQLEAARRSAYTLLTDQVKNLMTAQSQLQSETGNLVKALRAPATRGRVVEMAGMIERCDFREQHTIYSEDGRLRPDMTIQLPNQRTIVVDSKVPLTAFLDALDAPDEAARSARLIDHAQQVRTHVQKLSRKEYWSQFETAPEFVVLFLPGETFFGAALEKDAGLIEYGVDQRVIIATPTTLIALLKAVAYGWRQERIAENAKEISALGAEIHDRLRTLAAHFTRVGVNLEKAMEAYNASVGALETRILPSARRIKERGATSSEDIPSVEPIERAARSIQSPDLNNPET
jgi:DNA recombination protein RmuC